jgi:hypothetical protein
MQKHALEGDAGEEDAVGAVKTTPEGDKYVELGKKKRATVRTFKGAVLRFIISSSSDFEKERQLLIYESFTAQRGT